MGNCRSAKRERPIVLGGIALVVLWASWAAAAAETTAVAPVGAEAESGRRIQRVDIRGNDRGTTHRILGQMRLREGSTYTPAAADEDLKRIYTLGEFDNVVLRPEEEGDGLVLVVELTERPTLRGLEFVGARRFKTSDLTTTIGVTVGGLIDRHKVFTGARAIEQKYREKGYYFVSVTLDEVRLAQSQVACYTISEGPRVRVRKVAFVGNDSIASRELLSKMTTRPWFPIFVAGTFDEDQLDRDVVAVRNYYVDQGFLDVRVQRELVFNADKTRLEVRVVVEEGQRYRVRAVAIVGVERFSRPLMQKQMRLKQGAYYTADDARLDSEMIRDTYGEIGYIEAMIRPLVDFTEEPGEVDVTFQVTEGRQVRIGQIRVEGNRLTQDKVIRRELRFFPEEPVNTKLIERARKRLEGLAVFKPQSVEITTIPGPDSSVCDVLVRVEETETTNLILGAGISSNSGVLGNISLVQRNFDLADWPKSSDEFWRGESFRGAGQYLGLVLEPGTELQRYRIDFREPRLADSTVGFSSSTFFFNRDRDTYDEQRVGENAGLSKELWETFSVFSNFRVEGIDIKDLDADVPQDLKDVEGSSVLTSIELGVTRDTTDSDYTFTKFVLDGRRYWTVTRDVLDRRSILALHGRLGFIPNDAPIFERFYAGGTGSIRGFEFRGVGPREGDTPIGGDFIALASAEYSFPIVEKTLSGVFFLDTGTVEKDITVNTWRASVGFGIRFTVPMFGPVPFSFDFGFPIAKGDDDETEIFSFSIGTAF